MSGSLRNLDGLLAQSLRLTRSIRGEEVVSTRSGKDGADTNGQGVASLLASARRRGLGGGVSAAETIGAEGLARRPGCRGREVGSATSAGADGVEGVEGHRGGR
jgi:hypothetical protein